MEQGTRDKGLQIAHVDSHLKEFDKNTSQWNTVVMGQVVKKQKKNSHRNGLPQQKLMTGRNE